MKKTRFASFCLSLIMVLLSIAPITASAVNQPTIEDYMEISMEIIEKYGMEEKMEYGINMIPNRTLEEHRKFMESIVSMTAYSYQRMQEAKASPSVTKPLSNSTSQITAAATSTKRYTQQKFFYANLYFTVSCTYKISLNGYNAWVSSSTQEIKNSIWGRASILGGLRGYLFNQTSSDVLGYEDDGSFEVISRGDWTFHSVYGDMDYGTLGIVQKFGAEELAYARENGEFK